MDDYRSLFPIAKQFAYLNHAAVGQLPTPTVEAVNRFCDEQATMASVISTEWTRRVGEVRRKMADFVGAAIRKSDFAGTVTDVQTTGLTAPFGVAQVLAVARALGVMFG